MSFSMMSICILEQQQQQQQAQQQHQQQQQQQQPYVHVVNGVPPKSPGMSLTGGNVKNVQVSVASQATALVSQSQMITSQAPSGAAMIPGQTQIISPFQCVPMTQQFVPQGLTWATGLQQPTLFGPNQIVIRGPQPEMIFQTAPQPAIAQHTVAPAPVPNQVVKARPSADSSSSTLQPKAAPRQLSTILPMSTTATTPTPIRPASSVSTQTSGGTQATPATTPRAPGKGRKAAVSRPGQAAAAKNDANQVRMAAPVPVVQSHMLQAIPHQQLTQQIITQPGQLQFQIQQPIQVQQFPAQALQQHPQLVHLQQQHQQQPQQPQQQQGDINQGITQVQDQQQQQMQQQQHQQQMQQLQQQQQQHQQQQQLQPPKLTPMQNVPVSSSVAPTPAGSPAPSSIAPPQHLAAPQQSPQHQSSMTPLPPPLTSMAAPPAAQMPPLQQVVLQQQQPVRSSYKPIAPAPPPVSSTSSSEAAVSSQPMQHGLSSSGIVTVAGINSVNGGILTMSSAPLSAMVNMTNAVQPSTATEPVETPVPVPVATFAAPAPVVTPVPTSEAQIAEFPQVPVETKPEQSDVSSSLSLSVTQTPEPMETEPVSHQVNGVSPSLARDRKEVSPPRAVVRPQILTHVLGDFVIQESAEPFPIGRSYTSEMTTNGHDRVISGQASGEPPRKTARVETVAGTAQIPSQLGPPKNVSVATCESCGKMDLASRFRRSKRFCTAACAKRFAQQHSTETSAAPGTPQQLSPAKISEKPLTSPVPDLSKAPLVIPAAVATVVTDTTDKEDSTLDAELLALAAEQMKSPVLTSNPSQTPTQQLKQQEKVNPAKWTVNEVVDFVRSLPGCADYAEDFALQEIDGQALMLLKADHLMTAMNMKLGPAVKICAKIDAMKADLNSSSNNATGNNKQTP